jgi:hypothetical protein
MDQCSSCIDKITTHEIHTILHHYIMLILLLVAQDNKYRMATNIYYR